MKLVQIPIVLSYILTFMFLEGVTLNLIII